MQRLVRQLQIKFPPKNAHCPHGCAAFFRFFSCVRVFRSLAANGPQIKQSFALPLKEFVFWGKCSLTPENLPSFSPISPFCRVPLSLISPPPLVSSQCCQSPCKWMLRLFFSGFAVFFVFNLLFPHPSPPRVSPTTIPLFLGQRIKGDHGSSCRLWQIALNEVNGYFMGLSVFFPQFFNNAVERPPFYDWKFLLHSIPPGNRLILNPWSMTRILPFSSAARGTQVPSAVRCLSSRSFPQRAFPLLSLFLSHFVVWFFYVLHHL